MRRMSEIASEISKISGDTKKASREFLSAFTETIISGLAVKDKCYLYYDK